jgi:NAD(P)-dependent dehydrogenase (short-subunit alcohol dehydrogenase family)
MRFAGTTVVITGAAGGLGSVMAGAFAAEGGRVAVVHLPAGRGALVAAEINSAGSAGSALFVPCDLADLDRTSDVMGAIAADGAGVLVNNAAIYPSKLASEDTVAEWQAVQLVNVDAAFVCAHAACRTVRLHQAGSRATE